MRIEQMRRPSAPSRFEMNVGPVFNAYLPVQSWNLCYNNNSVQCPIFQRHGSFNRWIIGLTWCPHAIQSQSLSSPKMDYHKSTSCLDDIIYFFFYFYRLKIGQNGGWKPFQTGIIMATRATLAIQEEMFSMGHRFLLLTSMFAQDCLENIFSCVRAKTLQWKLQWNFTMRRG